MVVDDGQHASLTCGTSSGKVFVHCPHDRSLDPQHNLRFLNINRRITALAAGQLDPARNRDVLAIGSQQNLLVFDVESNSDVFFRDIADGVSAVTMGTLGTYDVPLVIVGGNCSIQGFDAGGQERYWTVTGDNVTTMCLTDVAETGRNELLVGSADFELRSFEMEEVHLEISETDRPVGLCALTAPQFGYALGNGTVGVYRGADRSWRARARGEVRALTAFDIDGDGLPELISGWASGRVEARKTLAGDTVFKDHMATAVSVRVFLGVHVCAYDC